MLQNIPHQIVQSPARLGLPNPNSPSLQNSTPSKFSSQNPQTHPPHPASNQLTTPSVSSTLLPLLPPLPRAQSLLLQMASLTSKLFEVSPNRPHWISAFRGSLPTFLSSQTQSLSLPQKDSSPSSSKEIVALFTILQTQLFEAVAELQEILDLQDAKQKLAREIRSKDSTLLAFANKLREAENVLDILVDDYSDYRRPKRARSASTADDAEDSSTTTVSTRLNLSDILSYAHKISYTTFAPPEFGAGQAPLRGALPPAPQEEQMRASQLYAFADLDIGLPKTDEDKAKIIEPLIEAPAAESNPLANMPAMQGLLPPNIVVPSGWKPGMPVELPSDLPILPPPGWKPGDPVTLPPVDPHALPPRVEDQKSRAVGPPKAAPEPIQVRHVQLDIEDDSSDYSSDVGSSDSED
ncbi:mediator of RNA polymerase II transcription subunit 4 [Andrographis paniculata]|uniref:mediator of RNA polymerase II transcription subunit 4 n=1 Tax=Andrographis paniculata TaxID=175694 RepID=UPI0021E75AD8|nr:mediator of RNA polymerase II transcription subunit 4 [Andrographis paniculata]XP_051114925.1 mediator of RNA polymerase II transcription subunit 4 [Andrographis paniculata]